MISAEEKNKARKGYLGGRSYDFTQGGSGRLPLERDDWLKIWRKWKREQWGVSGKSPPGRGSSAESQRCKGVRRPMWPGQSGQWGMWKGERGDGARSWRSHRSLKSFVLYLARYGKPWMESSEQDDMIWSTFYKDHSGSGVENGSRSSDTTTHKPFSPFPLLVPLVISPAHFRTNSHFALLLVPIKMYVWILQSH